jgi:hypothetical protein
MRTLSIHPYIRAAVLIGAGPNLVGCSGTTDAGPSIPRVAGTYSITESVTAVTCTPQEPPAGGTVQLEAFSQTFDVQIDQTGSALKLYELGHPEAAEAGTIDADGRISFNGLFTFEEAPREGNRVFFVDLTIHRELQTQATAGIAGSATYVDVFHEGSSTAPIYATCSRQGTNDLVRQ